MVLSFSDTTIKPATTAIRRFENARKVVAEKAMTIQLIRATEPLGNLPSVGVAYIRVTWAGENDQPNTWESERVSTTDLALNPNP